MEHGPELSDTTPSQARPAEALARLGRFFRRGPVAVGELTSPPDDIEQSTAEFDVLDMRDPESRFPLAMWGGYDRAAVDMRIGELEDELVELRAQLDPEYGVERELQQLSDETADILRVAHGRADAMAKKAQADADALIADAEARAAAMVADAEQRLRRLDQDTDLVWGERMRLTEDTRRLAETLMQVADSAAERFPPETPAAEPPPAAQPGAPPAG